MDFSSVPGVTGTMEVEETAIVEAAEDTEDTEGASQGTRKIADRMDAVSWMIVFKLLLEIHVSHC